MKSYSKFILPSVYLGIIAVMVMSVILVLSGISRYLNDKTEYNFAVKGVFDDEMIPVVKTNTTQIIKPYNSDKVSIGKYFYDFESDETKQEQAIVYYESTYMQNDGVDYVSDSPFDIVAIYDGEVISVEENEIYGNIVTIKHTDNLTTVYSNIKDILINTGYKVSQGEIIATSTTTQDNKNALHFEVYYKGNVIDPENLYTLNINELK